MFAWSEIKADTNTYYSNIFILFMDDRGSTCHHVEMQEGKTGRLMDREGESGRGG